jgi:hypothetical protein
LHLLLGGTATFAAAAALVFVFTGRSAPVPSPSLTPPAGSHHSNRIKGLALDATIRIAGRDGHGQRAAAPGSRQALRAGERLRIGYRAPASRRLVAIAIDDGGRVTALYPEGGAGLRVDRRAEITYLPDSLELTGRGRERIFLVLAEGELRVDDITAAARAAHARHRGDLAAMAALPLGRGPDGPAAQATEIAQFTWLFDKP